MGIVGGAVQNVYRRKLDCDIFADCPSVKIGSLESFKLYSTGIYGKCGQLLCCLYNSGCNVNAKDEDKNTPLHYATENGHLMSVQILLEAGARLSAKNDEHDTPVHTASENGHLE